MTTTWKKAIATTAIFAAVACMALAAKGDGKSAAADNPKTKAIAAARTLIAQYAAKEVGLSGDKADKFVADVLAYRQSSDQKLAEARSTMKDKGQLRAVMDEQEKGLDAVLAASLTADQAARAKEILTLQGLGGSVVPLLTAGIEKDKVVQALPVLFRFHKTEGELLAKARSKDAREDYAAKARELRGAVAKDLAPIIGESAAGAWQARADVKPSKGGPKPGEQKSDKPDKPGKPDKPAEPLAW